MSNMRQNLQVVVSIATKYSEQLTPDALTRLFEENRCHTALPRALQRAAWQHRVATRRVATRVAAQRPHGT